MGIVLLRRCNPRLMPDRPQPRSRQAPIAPTRPPRLFRDCGVDLDRSKLPRSSRPASAAWAPIDQNVRGPSQPPRPNSQNTKRTKKGIPPRSSPPPHVSRALRHLVEPPAMRRPPRQASYGGSLLCCRRDRDRQGPRSPIWICPRAREGRSATWSSRRRCGDRRARPVTGAPCFAAAAIAIGKGPRSPIWICPRAREGRSATWSSRRRCGDRRARPVTGAPCFAAAAIAIGKGAQTIIVNKATADQSPLLELVYPISKDVYASAIGLCTDSMTMKSRETSNSDL